MNKKSMLLIGTLVASGVLAKDTTSHNETVQAQDYEPTEETKFYSVEPGDTMSEIAFDLNVGVNKFASYNGFDTPQDLIHPGDIYYIPQDDTSEIAYIQAEDVDYGEDVQEQVNEIAEETQEEPVVEESPVEYEVVQETTDTSVPYYVYQVVESEAGNSYYEKAMVMSVIVNRANSGEWGGTTLMSVVQAPGQFEVTWNGMAENATPDTETIQAVNDVVNGGVITGADSFHASGDGVTNVFHSAG